MDCVFCKIVSGEIPSGKVYEDGEILAFNDIHPAAPVHILIIPKRHISTLSDAGDGDAALLGKLLLAAKNLAKEKGVAYSGYRTLINCNRGAGQTVFHLHVHLLGGKGMGYP
ncbi:MAG: histidine triad nucleotide-binding protein [Deltaproteobacteria bacterium]|nr:histidine triad nucleotide-binding protein [Deltaproteobacteria bacterium]